MFTKDEKFIGNYSIGLDIGTESVGWAVVDDEMNLVKRHGRHLWGSRLFDKAESAKDRRAKRSLRRRLARRHVRLMYLRNLFADFVNDDAFFERLDESFLQRSDRSQKNYDILFYNSSASIIDNNSRIVKRIENDQQYFENFPTIFHLREKMITDKNSQFDPKLIYLAVHNILKYRGNFLYESLNLNTDSENNNLKDEFFKDLDEVSDAYTLAQGDAETTKTESNFLSELNSELNKNKFFDILMDNELSSKEKTKNITNIISSYPEQIKQFVLLLLGNKFDYSKFFILDNKTETENKDATKLSFSDDVEEKIANAGEYADFLLACQKLYSIFTFQKLMQGKKNISEIMIERYKIYNEQLHTLKGVFRECLDKNEYKEFFRNLNISSKVNYARFTEGEVNCSLESLYKEIKKKLEKIKQNEVSNDIAQDITNLLNWIDEKSLFIKPRNRNNAVFPMQANRLELETILQNQSKFYPELAKGGELYEKTMQLFNFRIDYFVGPLAINEKNKENFGWLIRSPGYENTTITPFNYKEAIDIGATQTKFIERMTGTCSYILGEKALPKNSIYYCWFNVINEIANLRVSINGGIYQPINNLKVVGKPVAEYIIDRLKETNTYKKKDLINLLHKEYDDADVRFANGESLISNLKPYRDFMHIFGYINNQNIGSIENIIRDLTIFGENKEGLKKRLKGNYPELNSHQIKSISALNYKGWGNLSKKLIYRITAQNELDRGKTILQLMGENLRNFSSVYNDAQYSFKEQVEKIWAENKLSLKDQIDELTASAEVKKGIRQAVLIVQELEKVMGKAPNSIFVEFARETQEKKRTNSRQKKLAELYDKLKTQYKELYSEISADVDLNVLKDETKKDKFSEEKFYLYFLQGGKCMYTREKLDINKLDQYDVDHIIPQSIIKDDSIDNKVLVTKQANMDKTNSEVVPEVFRNDMKGYWLRLKNAELISADKYSRLTRKEFTDYDLGHFIKRQLVETRQITKNTAMLLSEYFKQKGENVGIYPIKAGINSLFRKRFGYPKGEGARAINDLHHAKDAYISAFMGSYLLNNFNLENIEERHTTGTYYKGYLLGRDSISGNKEDDKYRKYGIVFYYMNKENSVWDKTNNNSITVAQALQNFDNNYYKIDCYVSRKTEMSNEGQLFKETLYKNEENRIKFGEIERELVSVGKKGKASYLDVKKYGGYTTKSTAKFAIVSNVNKKGVIEYKFLMIPRIYTIKTSDLDINDYFRENGLNDAKVVCYIPKYQLVVDKNLREVYIAGGRSKYTAHQFIINRENKILNNFIYFIYKYGINFEQWLNDIDYAVWDKETITIREIENFIHNCFEKFSKYYLTHLEKYYPQDTTYSKVKNLLMQANNDYSALEKVKLMPELLNITANNANTGNLKEYTLYINNEKKIFGFKCYNEDGELEKLAKDSGTITQALSLDDTYFIYNSVTGIYSKKQKVLD